MATLDELRTWTDNFLTEEAPSPPEEPSPGLLAGAPEAEPRLLFSPFLPEHAMRAGQAIERLFRAADAASGEDAMTAVREETERTAEQEGGDLARFALRAFITHHPEGRLLPLRPLEERAPWKVVPSSPPDQKPRLEAGLAADPERRLDWYREDPKANEHHEHWHEVYLTSGDPRTKRIKNRHGELFFYMHEQMLARYDTERLGVGLDRAVPFSNYRQPIAEGYDPAPWLRNRNDGSSYGARRPNQQLRDLPRMGIPRAVLDAYRSGIQAAIDAQTFRIQDNGAIRDVPVEAQWIGAAEEGNKAAWDTYGNHHGIGHVLIAYCDPDQSQPGVMIDTATAIRDPVFYRWHRHVDDVLFGWQETLDPRDSLAGPSVRMRHQSADGPAGESPDVLLAFTDALPVQGAAGSDYAAFAEERFGGGHWDESPDPALLTDVLETGMYRRTLPNVDPPIEIEYLDQREFMYFLRIENLEDQPQDVVVRIFMIAQPFLQGPDPRQVRRFWIEMDKFPYRLAPGRNVVPRLGKESSVIRKPASKLSAPAEEPQEPGGGEEPGLADYCDCGWPYNLLVPRGAADGLAFRLMVLLTPGSDFLIPPEACGSDSMCGTRTDYPDVQSMGFPFDRRFPDGRNVLDVLNEHDNAAVRSLTVRLLQ